MEEMKWVVEINEEIKNNGSSIADEEEKWKTRSIFKVPSQLKELNKNAYKPQTVSFGPYHHGEENLMAMEKHKHRALIRFLKRCNKPFEELFQRLDAVVHELRDSYVPLDQIWKDDKLKFLQMMILDGCFILEIVRRFLDDHDEQDLVFGRHGKLNLISYIKRDMLILENQIPMTVLHILFEFEKEGEVEAFFYPNFMEMFFSTSYYTNFRNTIDSKNFMHILDSYKRNTIDSKNFMHILDLFRKCAIHMPGREEGWEESMMVDVSVRSAVELDEAGISFQINEANFFGDVYFNQGVLRLPVMVLDKSTEYIFHNLTAFERFNIGVGKEVTMYLLFMCSIINSAKDVSVLCQSRILINNYGSYEDIANLFNSLPREIPMEYSLEYGVNDFIKTRSKINHFCRKRWNRNRATLIQTYFRNPWSMVSLVAAIFLFALTIIQTGYSIAQFYQKPK